MNRLLKNKPGRKEEGANRRKSITFTCSPRIYNWYMHQKKAGFVISRLFERATIETFKIVPPDEFKERDKV